MIDGVSVNSETLVKNTGEGQVSSPPPSSTEIKHSESSQRSAEVELSFKPEVQQSTQSSQNAEQLEQSIKSQVEKSSREEDLEEQLQETVQALNDKLARLDREILFKVDRRINRNYISVIDKNSKEIIREFPPEEIRTFIARFDEFNKQINMSADVKSLIINLEV